MAFLPQVVTDSSVQCERFVEVLDIFSAQGPVKKGAHHLPFVSRLVLRIGEDEGHPNDAREDCPSLPHGNGK